LLAILSFLAGRIGDFRAVLVGDLKRELQPQIEGRGLSACVEFADFVSEEEKFRLFHSSRLFLMTSRFEGSPRVVGEALACGVPVIAYDVETYRPIFGEFLHYVPCFDLAAFQQAAAREIVRLRAGENYLSKLNLEEFCRAHSWPTVGQVFFDALAELS
jgi:glycosyltransferase involved in cell wall biosynthesis